MKRILALLILSGIVVVIIFTMQDRSDSSSQSFTRFIYKQSPKLDLKVVQPKKANTLDISRVIANKIDRPALDSLPRRYPKPDTKKSDSRGGSNEYLPEFGEGDDTIKRIANLYAVSKKDFVEGSYEVIEKRNSFYIVKSEFALGDGSMAVVGVKGSKHLGIATGVLKIELFDYSQKDLILSGYDYEIQQEYEHLNRVFYKFETLEDARSAYSFVKDKVESAQLEILQFERSER